MFTEKPPLKSPRPRLVVHPRPVFLDGAPSPGRELSLDILELILPSSIALRVLMHERGFCTRPRL